MPIETLCLIAYCFGFVLNALIVIGVASRRDIITVGDCITAGFFISISFLGTALLVIGKTLSMMGHVVYRKRQHRPDRNRKL